MHQYWCKTTVANRVETHQIRANNVQFWTRMRSFGRSQSALFVVHRRPRWQCSLEICSSQYGLFDRSHLFAQICPLIRRQRARLLSGFVTTSEPKMAASSGSDSSGTARSQVWFYEGGGICGTWSRVRVVPGVKQSSQEISQRAVQPFENVFACRRTMRRERAVICPRVRSPAKAEPRLKSEETGPGPSPEAPSPDP